MEGTKKMSREKRSKKEGRPTKKEERKALP
jgi:hypothetical protein